MIEAHWYSPEDETSWNAFIAASDNGTFLHSRKFLSYHDPAKIRDRSVVFTRKGRIIAVLPANDFPDRGDAVLHSHGGLTYGGLVVGADGTYAHLLECFEALTSLALDAEYTVLNYKAVPLPFQRRVRQEDLHILWNREAKVIRRDISSAVALASWNESQMEHGRRQKLSKFRHGECRIETDSSRWAEFWSVLEEVLRERHDSRPVHSLEEILLLHERFPAEIRLHVVLYQDQTIAGVVEFAGPTWMHSQYMASGSAGRPHFALDGLLVSRLHTARAEGRVWYSFGISVEDQGHKVNAGLLAFKESVGALGIVHETMRLDLKP